MRIHPFVYGVLVLAIFLGTILGFQSAGIWSVSGKITANGEKVLAVASDVDSIKGWMTLEDVSITFNVPMEEILKQFNLPADTPPSTALKDLETDLFSITNLRAWLEERANPSIASTPEVVPIVPNQSAVTSTPVVTPQPTTVPTVHTTPAKTLTGKTTFQELMDWGLSKEAIQQVIGGDLPSPSTIIKDYVTAKGIEFTIIKTQLQAEVDKVK